jgi:hypothetical protein
MEPLEIILSRRSVSAIFVPRKEAFILQQQWLEHYACAVKEQTGKWLAGEYKWQAFSQGFHSCAKSSYALEKYLEMKVQNYFIMNESGKTCFRCHSETLPDLSEILDDLYVFPPDFSWTMVFTHEQTDFGPYFAESNNCKT